MTIRITRNHVLSAARFVAHSHACMDDVNGDSMRTRDGIEHAIRHVLSTMLAGEGTEHERLSRSELLDEYRASYLAERKRREARREYCVKGRV